MEGVLNPLYRSEIDSTDRITQASKLAKSLKDGTTPLYRIFSSIQRNHPNHRVLLIADQFEDIFTLCENQETRHRFLDTLLASFQSSLNSSSVLAATMRADYLGNTLEYLGNTPDYRPFANILKNPDSNLGTMNHEELSQVIVKPANKLEVTFEAGLVERILNDVEDEPGNLPLLELALTELWKRRKGKKLNHTAYKTIGGVKGILARHAEQSYRKLSTAKQEQMRRIFIQLVNPGAGTKDTRRLATKPELGEERWCLVKQLADARLVVTNRNAVAQETVEIAHEALIHNWGKLRQWMNADRTFRAWQERLRSAIHQWEQTQRDEGALLRDMVLADAEEKLEQRQDYLAQLEQEFIIISIALRDRKQKQRQRRKKRTVSALRVSLVLNLALTYFVFQMTSVFEPYRIVREAIQVRIDISENERQDISQSQE